MFSEHESLRNDVIIMLDEIDSETPLSRFLMPGSRLAMDMLDDDIAVGQPKYVRLLVQRALRLLENYPGETISRLAAVLHDAASHDIDLIHLAIESIETRIAGQGKTAITAVDALAAWAELAGDASVTAKSRLDQIKTRTPRALEQPIDELKRFNYRDVWQHRPPKDNATDLKPAKVILLGHIGAANLHQEHRKVLDSVVRNLFKHSGAAPELRDAGIQSLLVQVITNFEPTQWPQAADIELQLNHWMSRQPVPEQTMMALIPARKSPDR